MRKKPTRAQRFAREFIRLIRAEGGECGLQQDGSVGIFTPKPLPWLLAGMAADLAEEIAWAIQKERPRALPYTHLVPCPDCKAPFKLIALDATRHPEFPQHVWRCDCRTLLGVEL